MNTSLNGTVLMLSAALPRELEGTPRAASFIDLVVALVVEVGRRDGQVLFGGHPTVTPIVHDLIQRDAVDENHVILFLPAFFDGKPPLEAHDTTAFPHRFVIGKGASPADADAFAADLTEMRTAMAGHATSAVFVGGQTKDSLGKVPGLFEEFELFRAANPTAPAFVTGVLDGYSRTNLVPELLAGRLDDHSGLPPSRRQTLFDTTSADEAAAIVITQLVALATSP